MKKLFTICLVGVVCFGMLLSGCEITGDPAKDSAITGGILGAGAGQLIGGDTGATIGGAVIGAGAGYVIGQQQKKTNQRIENLESQARAADLVEVEVVNPNGSRIIVVLEKDGRGGFYGPKGEHYYNMPSEDQLCQMYCL